MFLTTTVIPDSKDDDFPAVEGFSVYIRSNELLGSITRLISNRGQWLINIKSAGNKNILVPFHEHFIVTIDRKKKIIVMDLPDGLTELN